MKIDFSPNAVTSLHAKFNQNNIKTVQSNGTTKNHPASNISFKSAQWNIPYIEVKTPYDAMVLYNYLKVGKYLDTSDKEVAHNSKSIRENNLGFLNALKTTKDKKNFIDYFEEVTGFPDLEKVSDKIEREFIIGIKKSSADCSRAEAQCVAAGYDGICSVGKRRAFPGSDLDKAFIILRGSYDNNPQKDDEILNEFKNALSNNIDQRILSFNHDTSFPTVYTINQIKNNLDYINSKTKNLSIDKKHLEELMNTEYKNLYKGAEYNRTVSHLFPIEINAKNRMSKEDVKNFGYIAEFIRESKYLINSEEFKNFKDSLNDYDFYNYSNVSQLRATKIAIEEGRENKSKIKLRDNMSKDFKSWSVDKQFDFIKNLIKYSCEDNDGFDEYFKNDRDVREINKELLNELTRGNKKYNHRPDFYLKDNHIEMEYATNERVNLYKGFDDTVLWIDTNEVYPIEEVCRQINTIKESEIFRNINKIQCKKPLDDIKGFYPINFKTDKNEIIYERVLNEN